MSNIIKFVKTVTEVLNDLKDLIEIAQYFWGLNEQYHIVEKILALLHSIEWATLFDQLHNMPLVMFFKQMFVLLT